MKKRFMITTIFILSCSKNNKKLLSTYKGRELFGACQIGNLEKVKLLIQKGENINVKDDRGRTALYYACRNGNIELIKLLIDNNADINAEGGYGNETALHYGCKSGNIELVKLLIEKGADINAKNESGITPLYELCESGNIELVRLLIEQYKLDVNTKDEYSQTSTTLCLC